MTKRVKIWTAVGVAILAGAGSAASGPLKMHYGASNPNLVLADGESGEGGDSAVSSYAITSTDANAFQYDARPQIKAYADHVHASYAQAKNEADNLAAAVGGLLSSPTQATLEAARKAWVSARPAYLRTEAFRFYDGPVEAIEGEINAWPMNEAFIDYVEGKPDAGIINGKDGLNIEFIATANQKTDEADVTTGWHAIEFLLWGQDLSVEGPGNRPATDYVAGTPANDRRRAYLKLVTEKLVGDLQNLEQAWAPGVAENYRARFEALDQREALGRIVNGMAILAGFEFMSERLGVALDSGDQEDEHSCFSDTTKQDFVYDLDGIKQVWVKTGLDKLVAAQDAALAQNVANLLQDAESKIAKLGDPWDRVLAAAKDSPERKDAEAAVVALQALGDGLKQAGNKLGVLVLIPTG